MKSSKPWITRIIIYLLGVITVSLGIVLCKKSNLGISPVSSIPYVLEETVSLSFGTLTILFHGANILIQAILIRRLWDIKILLQIPLAFLFGYSIDFLQKIIVFDGTLPANQLIALILSVFFTALGMVCMIEMDLIQNPPDGAVRELSIKLDMELGRVKVYYDITCIVLSSGFSLLYLKELKGFGIATIVSAVFVGKTVSQMKTAIKKFKNKERRLCY